MIKISSYIIKFSVIFLFTNSLHSSSIIPGQSDSQDGSQLSTPTSTPRDETADSPIRPIKPVSALTLLLKGSGTPNAQPCTQYREDTGGRVTQPPHTKIDETAHTNRSHNPPGWPRLLENLPKGIMVVFYANGRRTVLTATGKACSRRAVPRYHIENEKDRQCKVLSTSK